MSIDRKLFCRKKFEHGVLKQTVFYRIIKGNGRKVYSISIGKKGILYEFLEENV